jgi:hypothetical protein
MFLDGSYPVIFTDNPWLSGFACGLFLGWLIFND